MKKVLFLVPVMFAIMAVSCNKPQEQTNTTTEQPTATEQQPTTNQQATTNAQPATPAATTDTTQKKGN